jgi:hypothetical protein
MSLVSGVLSVSVLAQANDAAQIEQDGKNHANRKNFLQQQKPSGHHGLT